MEVGGRSGRLRCMRPLRGHCKTPAGPMQSLCIIYNDPMILTGSTSLMREMLRYGSGLACSSFQVSCKVEGAVRQEY